MPFHRTKALANKQLLKFFLVGVISNSTAYALYIILTVLSLSPESATTVVFIMSTFFSMRAHGQYTFNQMLPGIKGSINYIGLQILSYLTNLLLLFLFVDIAGLHHLFVQGMVTIFLAILSYKGMQKLVFVPTRR